MASFPSEENNSDIIGESRDRISRVNKVLYRLLCSVIFYVENQCLSSKNSVIYMVNVLLKMVFVLKWSPTPWSPSTSSDQDDCFAINNLPQIFNPQSEGATNLLLTRQPTRY